MASEQDDWQPNFVGPAKSRQDSIGHLANKIYRYILFHVFLREGLISVGETKTIFLKVQKYFVITII